MNEQVLNNISYGVYIVSTWDNGRPTGCVANSLMQVTAEPPMMVVSIHHDNYTHKCIMDTKKFSVSILREDSDYRLIGKFGYQSGKNIDKFDQLEYEVYDNMPVIKDCCGYITCEVTGTMETDTHTSFLAKIVEGDVMCEGDPMTYSYYHKVIKGKSPKNAPTYRTQK